jgi:excisionase family DNA binding protein
VPKAASTAEPEDFVSADTIAKRIGLSRSWVYNAADKGVIPSYLFGNRRRFLITEVEAWLVTSKRDAR